MEYLYGGRPILEYGKALSLRQNADLIIQMLQALVYLHRRGILHRDLKPTNALVVDGRARFDHGAGELLEPEAGAVFEVDRCEEGGAGATRARVAGGQQRVGGDDEAVEPPAGRMLPHRLELLARLPLHAPSRDRLGRAPGTGRKRRQEHQVAVPTAFVGGVV